MSGQRQRPAGYPEKRRPDGAGFFSPYASARISGALTIPVSRIVARSMGTIAPVAVTVAAGAPVGFMTADQASGTRSEEAVVSGDMTDNTADHGTPHAAAGICGAGR